MAFQSAPSIAQLAIQITLEGKLCENVLNYRFDGTYGQADVTALASYGNDQASFFYPPLLAASATYIQCVAKGLQDLNDYTSTNGVSTVEGDIATPQAPNHDALCVTLRSAVSGRSARGRFYTMATALANYDDPNTVSATYATAVAAMLEAFRTGANSLGWTMVVLSRRSAGAARAVGIGFPVTLCEVRNRRVDTQRNRMPVPN